MNQKIRHGYKWAEGIEHLFWWLCIENFPLFQPNQHFQIQTDPFCYVIKQVNLSVLCVWLLLWYFQWFSFFLSRQLNINIGQGCFWIVHTFNAKIACSMLKHSTISSIRKMNCVFFFVFLMMLFHLIIQSLREKLTAQWLTDLILAAHGGCRSAKYVLKEEEIAEKNGQQLCTFYLFSRSVFLLMKL